MDTNISRWILDFLLQQPLHDRTLNNLIRVLPLSIHDSTLKKAMLLRKLVSQVSKGLVSEEMLVLMERIEELDYQAGVTASQAIKAAYCDVAVDCTLRLLEESQDREARYFDAVKRIWRGRVLMMEMAENVGLVSDELLEWRDDIEGSVWDVRVYGDLLKKWRGCEALKSVRVYVAEAWENMGPSFLEQVVQTVGSEKIMEVLKPSTCPANDQEQHQNQNPIEVQSGSAEMKKRRVLPLRMRVVTRRDRGAKISDPDSQDGRAASKNDLTFTPEVRKIQEALKVSCKELQAVVKDPLPEAIQLADKVISSLAGDGLNQRCPLEERHTVAVGVENLSADKSGGAIAVNETNNDNRPCLCDPVRKKPCLMEKNSTARVYEWDDSLDDAVVDGSSNGNGHHLATPSTWRISPFKFGMEKLGKRRTKKKWSTSEEDTLRAGVEKYGKGNWKYILHVYKDIFDERTGVDLKDKWRNMTKD